MGSYLEKPPAPSLRKRVEWWLIVDVGYWALLALVWLVVFPAAKVFDLWLWLRSNPVSR